MRWVVNSLGFSAAEDGRFQGFAGGNRCRGEQKVGWALERSSVRARLRLAGLLMFNDAEEDWTSSFVNPPDFTALDV